MKKMYEFEDYKRNEIVQIRTWPEVNEMKCPYCDGELEEGAVISQTVPQWLKKDEKKGRLLNCKKHFTHNELLAYRCAKCKKIILED